MTTVPRKIEKLEIDSRYLQEKRSVRVSLPPSYDAGRTYPVWYGQDGEELFNFGRIVTQANPLMAEGALEPFLIVGVDADRARRREEYHPGGSRFESYCRFFAEELVPAVEQAYPAGTTADERVLLGDSLGGAVSLHLALDRPTLSRRVISFSGAFYPQTRERIQEEMDLSWLSLYQTIGLGETAFRTSEGVYDFVEMNRIARRLLEERGADVTYVEQEGEHVWGTWQRQIPGALRHFAGMPPAAGGRHDHF